MFTNKEKSIIENLSQRFSYLSSKESKEYTGKDFVAFLNDILSQEGFAEYVAQGQDHDITKTTKYYDLFKGYVDSVLSSQKIPKEAKSMWDSFSNRDGIDRLLKYGVKGFEKSERENLQKMILTLGKTETSNVKKQPNDLYTINVLDVNIMGKPSYTQYTDMTLLADKDGLGAFYHDKHGTYIVIDMESGGVLKRKLQVKPFLSFEDAIKEAEKDLKVKSYYRKTIAPHMFVIFKISDDQYGVSLGDPSHGRSRLKNKGDGHDIEDWIYGGDVSENYIIDTTNVGFVSPFYTTWHVENILKKDKESKDYKTKQILLEFKFDHTNPNTSLILEYLELILNIKESRREDPDDYYEKTGVDSSKLDKEIKYLKEIIQRYKKSSVLYFVAYDQEELRDLRYLFALIEDLANTDVGDRLERDLKRTELNLSIDVYLGKISEEDKNKKIEAFKEKNRRRKMLREELNQKLEIIEAIYKKTAIL